MQIPRIPANEAERLAELRRLRSLDTLPESIFENLTELAAELCETPMAAISLVDENRQWFKSRIGIEVPETSRDVAFCAHAILDDQGLVVRDASIDPRFADNPLVKEGPHIQFYAGIPLVTGDNHKIGTLCVMDRQARELSELQLRVLSVLARQVSRLLEQRSTEMELQKARGMLEEAMEASQRNHAIIAELNIIQEQFINKPSDSEAFDMILALLLRVTKSEYGFIGEVLLDEQQQPFLKTHALTNIAWDEATRKFYQENAPQGLAFRNLKTLFGHIMTDKKPVIANDPGHDPRRGGLPAGHPALNAFLGIPIMLGNELVGALGVANREGGYNEKIIDEIAPLVTTYANLIQARRDRIQRETAERQLVENEARLQRVIDASGLGYWDWNIETGETVFSEQWLGMLGYGPAELEQKADTWLMLMHPDDKERVEKILHEHFSGANDTYAVEHRLKTKSGEWRWILSEGKVVARGAGGEPLRMSGIHKDIHDKKTVEEQARQLEISQTMIQEVHHRIKNNLQIVSSMLAFQERKAKDPAVVADFEVTRNRVATIALLHESLYRSSRLDRISLNVLCRDLVKQIKEAFGRDAGRVAFKLEVEDIPLNYDQAGPCALILNELITNAIKHAFTGQSCGMISITGKLDTDARLVHLILSDDGIGMKEAPSAAPGKSIGMMLVHRLTEQLDATLVLEPVTKGSTWQITFKEAT
jgi:PAS domain S-box-containing protein